MSRRAVAVAGVAAATFASIGAGCGGGEPAATAQGPSGPAVPAAAKARLAAAHQQVVAALKQSAQSKAAYGGAPAFLPKPGPVDRIVMASAAHPVLASQGDTVALRLPQGRAHVTVVGPHVDRSLIGKNAGTTPTRFDLTVRGTAGRTALHPEWFTLVDQLGHVHRPTVTRVGGGSAAAAVAKGGRVRFSLRSVMPTGTGLLRYGPAANASLVAWDFTVEID